MKTVYPSKEVAHLWAHNTDNHRVARNAQGNVHFKGEILYSYAEPIARRLTVGKTVAFLYRDRSFSVTTSKHQSRARGAMFGDSIFTVKDIGADKWKGGGGKTDHKANLAHFRETIDARALRIKRSRKNAEFLREQLADYVGMANRYCVTFKLRTRFEEPTIADIEQILAKQREAEKRDLAKRRAAQQTRKAQDAKAREEAEQQLQRWLAGATTGGFPYLCQRNVDYSRRTDYLRLSPNDPGMVETSRGAVVPLPHIRRALPIVLRFIERGESFKPNGKTIHLGEYAVSEIDAQGKVTCGCHTFDATEVKRFAATLPTWTEAQTDHD